MDQTVPLSVSVQVEVAWGKLGNTGFIGITQDAQDFPFIQELGLSSYPYIVFNTPADLPDDYYSRLTTMPLFVSEGGWTSAAITANNQNIQGTPALQAAYITRQAQLLAARQLTDRVSIQAGSFFDTVPDGGDAYLLSHIIHDWNEDLCLTILGNCRRAMGPDGRLLIIEMVLPEGNTPHPGKMLDLMMLVGPGGQPAGFL